MFVETFGWYNSRSLQQKGFEIIAEPFLRVLLWMD